jgi:hypothetical protein
MFSLRRFVCCAGSLVWVASGAVAARAAGPAPAPPADQSLAAIAERLGRIEAVLRADVDARRVEILLKRVEVDGADTAPLQAELGTLRSELEQREEAVRVEQQQLEHDRRLLAEPPTPLSPEQTRELAERVEYLEGSLRASRQLIGDWAPRADEIEAELARRKTDRAALMAEIERSLARMAQP